MQASICRNRGGGGIQELIYVGGELASTIFCRNGSVFPTFGEEALVRSSCGCSKPRSRKVICSPRFGGGSQLLAVTGRGLPSRRLLFLGGIAWRTLPSVDGDARGLICNIFFCSKVFCVKKSALSIDRRYPRTRIEKVVLNALPVTTVINEISGSL
jgi:hypothetical protein